MPSVAEDPKAYHREWRRKHRDSMEVSRLKYVFGFDEAQARYAMAEAREQCHACGAKPVNGKSHCIDHDHETGMVRGVLCHNCNVSLGLLRHDPERLRSLLEYLDNARRFQEATAVLRDVCPQPQ